MSGCENEDIVSSLQQELKYLSDHLASSIEL